MASYRNIPEADLTTEQYKFDSFSAGSDPEKHHIPGHERIFIKSDEVAAEKIDLFSVYGAEIVILPASTPPDSYDNETGRFDMDITGADRKMMIC